MSARQGKCCCDGGGIERFGFPEINIMAKEAVEEKKES